MGRLGPVAYGLMVWNAAGQLMWEFSSGATTQGIQDLAITNAKIANLSVNTAKIADASISAAKIGTAQILTAHIADAQIVNAKIGNLEVDSAKIANLTVGTQKITNNAVTESLLYASVGAINVTTSETQIASITFGVLNVGDQVWVSGSASCSVSGGRLQLRLMGPGGLLHWVRFTAVATTGLTVQAVYTAGAPATGVVFALSILNDLTSDTVSAESISLVGLRRQK